MRGRRSFRRGRVSRVRRGRGRRRMVRRFGRRGRARGRSRRRLLVIGQRF